MTPTGYLRPRGEGFLCFVSVGDLSPLVMAFVAVHAAFIAGIIQIGRKGAEPGRVDTSD